MATILTLSEYKAAMGITSTQYDAQLTALLPGVNEFIEAYCKRIFGAGLYTEKREGIVNQYGEYLFNVNNKPIINVQSIAVKFRGVASTMAVTVAQLDIFEKAGYMYYSDVLNPSVAVIRPEYLYNFNYTIIYSGGANVPEPVKTAAIKMLSDTFEYFKGTSTTIQSGMTSNNVNLKGVKIGDYSETYMQGDRTLYASMNKGGKGIALTQTVKDLLAPYIAQGQSQ